MQRHLPSQGRPWAWSPGLTCPFSDCLVVGHSWSGTVPDHHFQLLPGGSRIIVVYDVTDQVVLGSLSPFSSLSLGSSVFLLLFTAPILSSSCCPERRLFLDLFHEEANNCRNGSSPGRPCCRALTEPGLTSLSNLILDLPGTSVWWVSQLIGCCWAHGLLGKDPVAKQWEGLTQGSKGAVCSGPHVSRVLGALSLLWQL